MQVIVTFESRFFNTEPLYVCPICIFLFSNSKGMSWVGLRYNSFIANNYEPNKTKTFQTIFFRHPIPDQMRFSQP